VGTGAFATLAIKYPEALFIFFKMLSDSETEDVTQLTINEHYAKAYAHRKEREELQKCAIHTLHV
jgi:hypothetical protein